jgi:hypothetical protein
LTLFLSHIKDGDRRTPVAMIEEKAGSDSSNVDSKIETSPKEERQSAVADATV